MVHTYTFRLFSLGFHIPENSTEVSISYTTTQVAANEFLERLARQIVTHVIQEWLFGNSDTIEENICIPTLRAHLMNRGEIDLAQWIEQFDALSIHSLGSTIGTSVWIILQ